MRNTWKISSLAIVPGVFVISGCNFPSPLESETPTPEIPVVIDTEVIPEVPDDALRAAARDAAL